MQHIEINFYIRYIMSRYPYSTPAAFSWWCRSNCKKRLGLLNFTWGSWKLCVGSPTVSNFSKLVSTPEHEGENKRSETEMVMQCGENDWKRRRGSNENMEVCGHRNIGTPKQSITFEASDRSRSLPLALIQFLASELSLAPIREIARYKLSLSKH